MDHSNIGGYRYDTENEALGYKYDAKNANPKRRQQGAARKLIAYNFSASQYYQMLWKGLKNDSKCGHYMSQAMAKSGV